MLSADPFWTESLRAHPAGAAITRILAAGIEAVEPAGAVRRAFRLEGDLLQVQGQTYDLQNFTRIRIFGLGKAAVPMAEAVCETLGERAGRGLLITKHIPESFRLPNTMEVLQGGHPVPDERSLLAGQRTLGFLEEIQSGDLLVCLISGGGSALISAPVEGVTLQDQQALARTMLASGAEIGEFNCLRRKLDRLKGGGMAKLAHGATIVSLVISDVVGNALEAIASGPTAPDPSTREDVVHILEKYDLRASLPDATLAALENAPEKPKSGDPIFNQVQNVILASCLTAALGALKQAETEGFIPYLLRADLHGEAREAAFELATVLRQEKLLNTPVPAPACIAAAGETTVTLAGNGKGGRNTELALAAVRELADFPGVLLATLATDGEDGPTDAAGAVVTPRTLRRGLEAGLVVGEFLERHDSYAYFDGLGDLLKPGPTGTNVNDLVLMIMM